MPLAMLPWKYCTRSTYHVIVVAVREIPYVWKPEANDVEELKVPPNDAWFPFASAQCMVPKLANGFCPCISIMSISPQAGHPTVTMLEPRVQNPGQIPCP